MKKSVFPNNSREITLKSPPQISRYLISVIKQRSALITSLPPQRSRVAPKEKRDPGRSSPLKYFTDLRRAQPLRKGLLQPSRARVLPKKASGRRRLLSAISLRFPRHQLLAAPTRLWRNPFPRPVCP